MAWENFVNQCVVRPSYELMARAYADYAVDSAPCKRGVTNQCAVRMSIALGRCGLGLEGFPDRRRVHTLFDRCRVPVEHVLGANELARFLETALGAPQKFRGSAAATAAEALSGRTGIIYFNNCFRRSPGGPKTGDHIDLWNGTTYYNIINRIAAGGSARVGAPLFAESDEVWFFPLAG